MAEVKISAFMFLIDAHDKVLADKHFDFKSRTDAANILWKAVSAIDPAAAIEGEEP